MNNSNKNIQEINGMLASIGFHARKTGNDDYMIANKAGGVIAHGPLKTIYYCAVFMTNDAKQHPEKYERMNAQQDTNALYQAGLAMAKRLQN